MEMNDNQKKIRIQNSEMIRELRIDGRCDEAVLDALETLDRQSFLPVQTNFNPSEMRPISIGHGQTMSAPFIVASMSSLLEVKPGQRILEIGTGCGYQTALLLRLGAIVCSIEIIPELARVADKNLQKLGFSNYEIQIGDGYFGWHRRVLQFDRIIAAATAPSIPFPWKEQLTEGGFIVMPLEQNGRERMVKAVKIKDELVIEWLYGVRFVPFVGEVRKGNKKLL